MNPLNVFYIEPDNIVTDFPQPERIVSAGKSLWQFDKSASAVLRLEIPELPVECCGVRIELKLAGQVNADAGVEVFACRIIQNGKIIESAPAIVVPDEDNLWRTVTLESCALIDPAVTGELQIFRCTEDPCDSFSGKSGLAAVVITALRAPESAKVVEDSPGYNSWPMCQSMKGKLVCIYSRGNAHNIYEPTRGVYARVSSDGGRSWEAEHVVCNTPGRGDVSIGKGIDDSGNCLFWVRHSGKDGFRHRLYRSIDGKNFECIAEPDLPLDVIQITDIFHVPGVGLMALYFAGSYQLGSLNYWGKLVSTDNGRSWQNCVVEKSLGIDQWPTEPAAVYLGNGRILVIARNELKENSARRAQFQLISVDYGHTWRKFKTNITDVYISTPSLVYDPAAECVSCYYFQRGKGILNRRKADVKDIFESPCRWPAPETVAIGSCEVCEAGNVNAVAWNGRHILAYYSGTMPDTAVYTTSVE